jgi:hypothetical protein
MYFFVKGFLEVKDIGLAVLNGSGKLKVRMPENVGNFDYFDSCAESTRSLCAWSYVSYI